MQLQSLGYVGIRSKDLDDWAAYGTRFLGMQLVDKSRGTLALRMDDRKQRVIITDRRERRAVVLRLGSRRCRARSMRWRRIWRKTACRSRAAHARWPTSAASRI